MQNSSVGGRRHLDVSIHSCSCQYVQHVQSTVASVGSCFNLNSYLAVALHIMAHEGLATLLPALKPLSSVESFEPVLTVCAQVAAGRKSSGEASSVAAVAGLPPATHASLIALLLEVARQGIGADELEQALAAVLPAERAKAVAALATKAQPALHAVLESISLGLDELVDVSWQRSTVAAAGREQPRAGGDPIYTVTLTLRAADGSSRLLQFVASIEDLTELVRYVCVFACALPDMYLCACALIERHLPQWRVCACWQGAQVCSAAGRARNGMSIPFPTSRRRPVLQGHRTCAG